MKITKHAQSCFLVETNQTRILIDPGKFVFEKEGLTSNDFSNIDVILISHIHTDHIDLPNILPIIERSKPIIITNQQVIEEVFKYVPVSKLRVLIDGETFNINGIDIIGVNSKHGPLPNGMVPPNVIGFLINDGKTTFYDPSDTVELYATANVIVEPICDKVVMDIKKAKSEALRTNPEIVIPMHYDNPAFPVDVNDFINSMKDTTIKARLLGFGESLEI